VHVYGGAYALLNMYSTPSQGKDILCAEVALVSTNALNTSMKMKVKYSEFGNRKLLVVIPKHAKDEWLKYFRGAVVIISDLCLFSTEKRKRRRGTTHNSGYTCVGMLPEGSRSKYSFNMLAGKFFQRNPYTLWMFEPDDLSYDQAIIYKMASLYMYAFAKGNYRDAAFRLGYLIMVEKSMASSNEEDSESIQSEDYESIQSSVSDNEYVTVETPTHRIGADTPGVDCNQEMTYTPTPRNVEQLEAEIHCRVPKRVIKKVVRFAGTDGAYGEIANSKIGEIIVEVGTSSKQGIHVKSNTSGVDDALGNAATSNIDEVIPEVGNQGVHVKSNTSRGESTANKGQKRSSLPNLPKSFNFPEKKRLKTYKKPPGLTVEYMELHDALYA